MSAPGPIPDALWLIASIILAAASVVYTRVIQHLLRVGGKVRACEYALPELLMSIVLASGIAMMTAMAFLRPASAASKVTIDAVLPSSLLFVFFAVGIIGFLWQARRAHPTHLFGLDQTPPLAVLGWAALLLCAAFPLTTVANAITLSALKEQFTPQPLVQLFSEVARAADTAAIAKIFVVGVIVQPACEELIFRGFFYGVWKRYLHPVAAGFIASLLFAGFHVSLPAFGGLFVLAICLNLAYERTGSLLVPIIMHALFNFASLLVLYIQARSPLPVSL